MSKIPLVLYSGGLDSTYLVGEYLSHTDIDVAYVDFDGPDNGISRAKVIKERQVRSQQKRVYRTVFRKFDIREDYLVTLTNPFKKSVVENSVFPIMLLTGLMAQVVPHRHNEVAMGYVDEDCGNHELPNMVALWERMWEMMFPDSPLVPLVFPLVSRHLNKLAVLRSTDVRLMPNVWICEIPTTQGSDASNFRIRACGRCRPCRKFLSTKYDFSVATGETYDQYYLRQLKTIRYEEKYPKKDYNLAYELKPMIETLMGRPTIGTTTLGSSNDGDYRASDTGDEIIEVSSSS